MYRLTVHPGRTLWEELAKQNIVIDRPCGGKGTCGRCGVRLSSGKEVLACQYRTAGQIEIAALPALVDTGASQSGEGAARAAAERFAAVGARRMDFYAAEPVAAADIGTTTVVFTLFWENRRATRSFVNPQRAYGADVMSRIRAANEGHGRELSRLLWERLFGELKGAFLELAGEAGTRQLPPFRLIVSANTTMQHLLEGLSCEGLGTAPFVPESLALREFALPARLAPVRVIQLPGISAFVGADVVSGLGAIDILSREKPVLFVDLGTNGELALGCRERLLVTSTAAGPAFEGSAPALRLHGAGLLKLLHRLLADGSMDGYGTLCDAWFDSGYPIAETDLVLTQEDIRELQMAKAAVCAGAEALLTVYGIGAEDVETVYLAGGFGCYLDPEDALAVGLLPEGLRRIVSVGNTSLEGAAMYAADSDVCERLEAICRRAEHISLPDTPDFEERYIERMNFPQRKISETVSALADYTVLDLEMTGLTAKTDKIIEIGALRVRGGAVVESYGTLVNPSRHIPEHVTGLTGITDEMASEGMPEDEAVSRLLEFIGEDVVVGHNVGFDYRYLKQWAVNHRRGLQLSAVDTLRLARAVLPEGESKKLESLCAYFQIPRENAHRALDDARETKEIFERLIPLAQEKKPELLVPRALVCHMKRQTPATARQVERLKEFRERHEICDEICWETLTRSEASRLQDQYYLTYGRD